MKTGASKKKTKNKKSEISSDIWDFFTPHLIGAGYGLLSTTKDHHLPRIVLVERILRKYRKKNSWFFLIKWALIKAPRKKSRLPTDFLPLLYQLANIREHELLPLAGIYRGLKNEKGTAIAVAASVEIAKASRQKDILKAKKK